MKIFIASDHAGFELKERLIEHIKKNISNTNSIIDLGTNNTSSCDYPIFANKLVQHLLENPSDSNNKNRGILICGTGIGMSIAANRTPGIRAALCFNKEMAIMSRKHNNSNVIVFGARIITYETAICCVEAFLHTDFDGGRHARRLTLIDSSDSKAECALDEKYMRRLA